MEAISALSTPFDRDFSLRTRSVLHLKLLQYPTKALAPLMLEDYRKVMVERRGEEEQFTVEHIADCMKKGTTFFLCSPFCLFCEPCFLIKTTLPRLWDDQTVNCHEVD